MILFEGSLNKHVFKVKKNTKKKLKLNEEVIITQ